VVEGTKIRHRLARQNLIAHVRPNETAERGHARFVAKLAGQ
jgi:hypothetical protein